MNISFDREHYKTVVPFLVMLKDYTAISTVAGILGLDTRQILASCMIETLVHILPLFAISKSPSVDSETQRRAQYTSGCYEELLKHIPNKVCS